MAGPRALAAAIAAALALTSMTACEPPPSRLAITVNSDGFGVDDSPGDGICASAASHGACTLTAAIDEANASPTGADVTLPPLDPEMPPSGYPAPDVTVTGDVRLIGEFGTRLGAVHMTVAPGAQLSVSRVRPTEYSSDPVSFRVEGTLVLHHAVVEHNALLSGAVARPVLEVTASGTVMLNETILLSDHSTAAVVNAGVVVAVRSSIAPIQVCPPDQPGCFGTDVAVHTAGDGQTHLAATAAHSVGPWETSPARCTGNPPVSHGYVHLEEPCGGTPAVGDSNGDAGAAYDFSGHVLTLSSTSPLVDAVPLTDPLCADATVDVFGVTRGLDGNSDGIGACEIGALER